MPNIIKRIAGLPLRFGDEEHAGWLPPGAATPLPTPTRHVRLDIEIEFDGHGYLLIYSAEDGSMSGDTWHRTLEDAEAVAKDQFGIAASLWQTVE